MEDVFAVANLDLLLITETHCSADFPATSRKVNVLANSVAPPDNGRSRAGIALVARSDGSWSCDVFEDIIPGHAILTKVRHSRSTKTFWILGVYGQISDTYISLEAMYSHLSNFMLDYIARIPSWPGCLALGDWNFTIEPTDCSLHRPHLPWETRICSIFDDIATSCRIDPSSYVDLDAPLTHTYFSNTTSGPVSSQLDRIYVPSHWSIGDIYTLPTEWSDHRLIWASCFITKPTVQIARPAPRIHTPPTTDLKFWSPVLLAYDTACSAGPSLESWTAFKNFSLSHYTDLFGRRWNSKSWKDTLK